MPFQRQIVFWLAALVVFILLLWLLSEILLPFVAGLAIAYLLTPLTDRLERLGVNRLAAALLIITVVVLAFVYLILLVAPMLGGQLSSFIDNVPGYVTKLQTLLTDPSRPWVQKLSGAGFNTDKVDRRSGDARRRLAHRLPEIAVVGRARAGVVVLAGGGDAGRGVLFDLRLAPHDPHGR